MYKIYNMYICISITSLFTYLWLILKNNFYLMYLPVVNILNIYVTLEQYLSRYKSAIKACELGWI